MEVESKYRITQCSPKAAEKIKSRDDPLWAPVFNKKGFYPYGELMIGDCFTVPLSTFDDGGATLRTMASKWGKKINRKFAVFKHTDENQCYEVARIA